MQVLHQMFNVFALLMDDALKPVTPLTNVFNILLFFSDSIIINFLLILTVLNIG